MVDPVSFRGIAMAQPLNATFFAFRNRGRGGVLTMMTITYLVLALVVSGGFFALNFQGFLEYIAWTSSLSKVDPNDPSAMMPPASVMTLMPSYLLVMFLTYLLLAAFEAGALRWMIRGEVEGLFGLSLGADTWRVWAGYWLWLVFFMLGYFGLIIVSVLVGGIGGILGNGSTVGVVVLATILAALIYLVVWLYLSVRLAPASAASVGRKRFSFFDAWKVTKGRFWALFGAYLLLFVIFIVAYIIVSIILGVALGFSIASQASQIDPNDPIAVFGLFASPGPLAALIVTIVVMTAASLLVYVGMWGVNARAVLAAAEEGKIDGVINAEVAKTFD
jgi:hypothetical protein